jgi:divalent metal cation (Fe/Co/Zn/Cd) transporter
VFPQESPYLLLLVALVKLIQSLDEKNRHHVRRAIGRVGWWSAFRHSKNPPSFITFFNNSAAVAGNVVAGAGTGLAIATGRPGWDGAASLVIGSFLAVSAVFLARESKGLLIGERAQPGVARAILAVAREIKGVGQANGVATVQLAPDQVVVNLSLEFDDALRTPEIEAAVIELERRLRAAHPEITAVFVKPQTADEVRRRLARAEVGVTPDAG